MISPANALTTLALLKCLAGLACGVAYVDLLEVNSGGVPALLPWVFSAWLAFAAVYCWRDVGRDARLLALLWALAGSWLADRSIRGVYIGAGEIAVEGAILALYVPILWRLGLLGRMARSTAREIRRVPRWIWRGVACLPVCLWSSPGAWLPLTAAAVYGPAVVGSASAIIMIKRSKRR